MCGEGELNVGMGGRPALERVLFTSPTYKTNTNLKLSLLYLQTFEAY